MNESSLSAIPSLLAIRPSPFVLLPIMTSPEIALPQPFDPHWTEIAFATSRGRDALGIETLSESLLADMLPGINNQTLRARYYSFWAWALRDFIKDKNARHTQQGFYEWMRSREDMLIFAYLSHGCAGGAAGTCRGREIWQNGKRDVYPLTWRSMKSTRGGAYALYYRGPLAEMNIILPEGEDRRHDALAKPMGVELADAYAEAVAGTLYVRKYLQATQVTREIIEDFTENGCFCQVSRHERERKALIHVFFRFDTPDANAVRRLASLSLFLDIIHQSQGQPLAQDEFRDVFYFWSYSASHPYRPEGNLLEAAQRWRIFQLRQWFVLAIEAPWAYFLRRIEIEPMTEEDFLAELLDWPDLDALAGVLNFTLPDANVHTLTVADFYAAIRDAIPAASQETGPLNFANDLNERHLGNILRHKKNYYDPQIMLGYALVMLVLTYWRAQSWVDQPGWEFLTDKYALGRMPMESYMRHVDRAIDEQWSIARWVQWLYQRYLWQQHRRVVLQKLANSGKDTSRFEYLDLPEHGDFRLARMRAIAPDQPKMNAPRFPSALSIFTDLVLIEPLSNRGYRLLAEAESLLDQFKRYQVPAISRELFDETASDSEGFPSG